MPYRSTEILKPGTPHADPIETIVLTHDQRHIRRKLLHMRNDDVVMLDLKETVQLADGDLLLLDSGDCVQIVAAEEALYEVRGRDGLHLTELAWHLGNRHLPAQIEVERILILRDHVIAGMLQGLGATVSDVTEPFQPVRGAYHSHDHR